MKTFKTTEYHGHVYTYIEFHDDLIDFLEEQQERIDADLGDLIRSSIPVDRWDHYTYTSITAVVALALMHIKLGKVIPLVALSESLRDYAKSLFAAWDKLADGEALLINENGGYNIARSDEVTNVTLEAIPDVQNVFITPETNTIVLENDPELPEWTVDNAGDVSYVVNLRKLSDDDLTQALWDFAGQAYPETNIKVLVYTTGMDVEQMKRYVDTIAVSPVECIEWVAINAEKAPFPYMVQYAQDCGVTATAYSTDDPRFK